MAFKPFFPPPENWAGPGAGLTEKQLGGIGAVVSAWSILDAVTQEALVDLAQSPRTLGQALTDDLGPDNRLKALKRLCETWLIIMPGRNAELAGFLEGLEDLRKWVQENKGRRNQIAHWLWMRQSDDKMLGFKYSTRPHNAKAPAGTSLTASPDDFWDFAKLINQKTDALIEIVRDLRRLPSWPGR